MGNQRERATIDLVINGQQSKATLYDIGTAATNTRKELSRMAETDPGYKKQEAELQALMRAQQQRIVKIHEEKTAWERFKAGTGNIMAGVVGGNIVATGLQKIMELGPMVVDRQLKIRDSFSDIGKAADLTDSEVSDLNDRLKKLDTRTATEELRNIAVVGGQFGIAKKDMEGFVESADKLNIALGDQFDSVEKVAETALTLRNTFQDLKTDDIAEDMMRIGNGLNYLEAQGAATAPVMADFSSRIGGIAIPLGLTSGQVLGLSATLQELNVSAERGSSAVTDILSAITNAPVTFAKYARGVDGATLSTKEFKELVNTDLNAALLAVIRGFKDGDTSATGLSAKLADMDLKGNGVKEVFMKLASNTDLLTQRQTQSAEALSNTSSITNEFSKKNFELAINIKKLTEAASGFFDFLAPLAEGIVSATVHVLGLNDAIGDSRKEMDQQRSAVADLEKSLLPLLSRYDKLKEKTSLSKDEQAELKKIVQQVSGVVPIATSEMDRYGNAIAISTDKARDFVKAQRELMKFKEKETLGEIEDELNKQRNRYAQVDLQVTGGISYQSSTGNGAAASVRKLSNEEIVELRKQRKAIGAEIVKLKQARSGITGEGLDTPAKPTTVKSAQDDAAFGQAKSEEEEKAADKAEKARERRERKAESDRQKAKQKADELDRMLSESRARTAAAEGESYEKELIRLGDKYKKMYELAGTNKTKQTEITTTMLDELAAIEQKFTDKALKKDRDLKARQLQEDMLGYEAELKLANKAAQGKLDIDAKAGRITESQYKTRSLDLEMQYLLARKAIIQKHYADIEKLGFDSSTKQVEFEKDKKAAVAEIEADITESVTQQIDNRIEQSDRFMLKSIEKEKARKDAIEGMLASVTDLMAINWEEQINGLKEFWQKATTMQKIAFVASKAYSAAEATMAYAKTLMNIWANSGNPWAAAGFTAIATATYGNVLSKIASANYNAPQFGLGGFTDREPGGYVDGPTMFTQGNFIAGEKGKEWIMSAPMLQNPVFANLAGAMQAMQSTGSYRNVRSVGDVADRAFGIGSDSKDYIAAANTQVLQAILSELQQGRSSDNRPVVLNYRVLEDYRDEVVDIRTEATM